MELTVHAMHTSGRRAAFHEVLARCVFRSRGLVICSYPGSPTLVAQRRALVKHHASARCARLGVAMPRRCCDVCNARTVTCDAVESLTNVRYSQPKPPEFFSYENPTRCHLGELPARLSEASESSASLCRCRRYHDAAGVRYSYVCTPTVAPCTWRPQQRVAHQVRLRTVLLCSLFPSWRWRY